MISAWTDYPISALGDVAGAVAPIRECTVLSYDGNKYCQIQIGEIEDEVKACYLYRAPGRSGEVRNIAYRDLVKLQPGYRRPRSKPACLTVSYLVYEPEYCHGKRFAVAKTKTAAIKVCRRFGIGSEVVRQIHKINRHGVSQYLHDPRSFIFR